LDTGASPLPIGTTGAALRQMEEAKRICRDCPVQIHCLAWALENGVTDGVWGGTTPVRVGFDYFQREAGYARTGSAWHEALTLRLVPDKADYTAR
jgi:hypothetical protein